MYFDRSSYGIFEGDSSQPKQVALSSYHRQYKARDLGWHHNIEQVQGLANDNTKRFDKYLIEYSPEKMKDIWNEIHDFIHNSTFHQVNSYEKYISLVNDHALGGKIINRIRMRTPIAKLREGDVPSPSRLDTDQMIMPNMTVKGEILNIPNLMTTVSPEKETQIKSANPYSIDNIPLVRDEKPVKLKKIYMVKSKQEMQKYNEEKFKMYN